MTAWETGAGRCAHVAAVVLFPSLPPFTSLSPGSFFLGILFCECSSLSSSKSKILPRRNQTAVVEGSVPVSTGYCVDILMACPCLLRYQECVYPPCMATSPTLVPCPSQGHEASVCRQLGSVIRAVSSPARPRGGLEPRSRCLSHGDLMRESGTSARSSLGAVCEVLHGRAHVGEVGTILSSKHVAPSSREGVLWMLRRYSCFHSLTMCWESQRHGVPGAGPE